jgi:hypothetical protein
MNIKELHELLGVLLKLGIAADSGHATPEAKAEEQEEYSPYLGKIILARGDRSGVFVGTLASKKGHQVVLHNVRWIWYWSGAATLFQLANEGVKDPDHCKFPKELKEVTLLDCIQLIPVSDAAWRSIKSVPVWER